MATEKTPLINSVVGDGASNSFAVSQSIPIDPNEEFGSRNQVNCQVCSSVLSLTGKSTQLVIKCNNCNEATPIKGAPPGKKYVRCPCNCLLICKSSTVRVACPRENCHRVIPLIPEDASNSSIIQPSLVGGGPLGGNSTSVNSIGGSNINVICARCGSPFSLLVTIGKPLGAARCPHCTQTSSIGPHYMRSRWIFWSIVACTFFIAAAVVTVTTHTIAEDKNWIYGIWAILYVISIFCVIRWSQFFFMPISSIECASAVDLGFS